jgi:predicted nucleic acid-binding protein
MLHENLPFKISVVTYMEIVQGMKNRRELKIFLDQLKRWSITVLQIDRDVSARAMAFVEEFFLSHSLQIADALIAATAIEAKDHLLTANDKHYKQIKSLKIVKFRP